MSTNLLQTHQHRPLEIRFQAGLAHAQPFRDVLLDVRFTPPSGRTLDVPAFWAGDGTWCVRYASAETGVHAYETRCSVADDLGLHGRSGAVEVLPYHGDNPLYRHGGLQIAPDRRHFCHADGTPFFWLGDTWWMGLCQRLAWPEDFQALAGNRKALGFNVIQLVAGLYPDMPLFDERGLSDSGFCWERGLEQINPRFFDEADRRVFHLVEQGLVPCILGAWGYYLPMIGLDNMKRHWRYLMARWGALPVVWAAAGEQNMPWYLQTPPERALAEARQKQDWSEVIAHMRRINAFERPISTHPFASARDSVTDAALIDFDMQQTNHSLPTAHHARRAWQGWQAHPAMPVFSAESRYEGLEVHPTVSARNAREAFWAHALNSGLAGHTYGANGIWQVNREGNPFGNSPTGACWGNTPWNQAMHLPGARHIGQARTFLDTLPWTELEPQPIPESPWFRLLQHRPRWRKLMHRLGWREGTPTPVALAVSRERSVALAYTVTDRPFRLDLRGFGPSLTASWVDPTTFEAHPIPVPLQARHARFAPERPNAAGDGDWLLVLKPSP